MTPRPHTRGTSLVEVLVGVGLGLGLAAGVAPMLAASGRLVTRAEDRLEREDGAAVALESLLFDLRRAGWDPFGAGVGDVVLAGPDRLTLDADLDGDGLVDPRSEEHTTHACDRRGHRLLRIVGAQSMSLLEDVVACGFRYVDRDGRPLVPGAAMLDEGERAALRAIVLDLSVRAPGVALPVRRSLRIGRRTPP
jgi:hypothetical protein